MLYLILIISFLAIFFSFLRFYSINKANAGTLEMQKISNLIHDGAITFLHKEYAVLSLFIAIIAIVLLFFDFKLGISFILGSLLSLVAGNIAMRVATKANSRTAEAARKSIDAGFRLAFSTGIAGSLLAFSLGLIGITLIYYLFKRTEILFSFSLGASFVALFMRVGGGIFTKSADIAADLSGKIEAGIPEDDPRNPAVIADLVGDNVGDIAGMGSDLFESYASSIIAAMAIAAAIFSDIKVPLLISAIGLASCFIAAFFVKGRKLHFAMLNGFIVASLLVIVATFLMLPINLFYAILSGLVAGVIISIATDYYTSINQKPTRKIALAAEKGAALDIIQGLANGMISAIIPVITIAATILVSYYFAQLYGIAIAAVGMLSIVGIALASDIYGSVSDNAAGISEFCKLKEARKRTEKLDELGNVTAAIGKGFAICSAALTALALLVTYIIVAKLEVLDITNAKSISALFIGAALPFLFSAFTMNSVSTTAEKLIDEVRRQFKNKRIMEGNAEPNYKKCISITTTSALKKMFLPSIAVIAVPLVIGILLGKEALGSLIAGSIATSFLLALFMANAGASLDNAKKFIELGNLGGKGTETHKASVIGDTVGDPLKDTAGPSLNILIKLMAITALIFASLS